MEEFLMALGVRVDGRTASAPMLTEEELEARMKIARPLAAKCRLERLTP